MHAEQRKSRTSRICSVRWRGGFDGKASGMSGIAGMYERGGAPVDRALLQALTHSISYCGPDARDTWTSGAIAFGHTMLRTTRESLTEQQPANLDGQFWITGDARIDCREELIEQMTQARDAASPSTLRTTKDSDLILRG